MYESVRRIIFFLAFLAVASLATTAAYASEPDVVVLNSGNRITGSVTELSRGDLSFSVAGAGTLEISWSNVVSLKSDQTLDVELGSGERFTGSISSPSDGKLEIKTAAGPKVVDMKDVVRIKPLEATFAERTSVSIDGGFAFLHANDEVDFTIDAELENRTRNYVTDAEYIGLLRRQNGNNNAMRHFFQLGSRRFLPNRWYVLGQFGVEEDQFLDLDLRILAAGALGRTLVQNNRVVFSVHGGFDYNLEQYNGVPGTSNTAEALGGIEWDLFGAENTELKTTATTYASLERARARLELDSSLRRDIFRNFYWAIRFFEEYDSDPPPGKKNSDFGVTLTIGKSF